MIQKFKHGYVQYSLEVDPTIGIIALLLGLRELIPMFSLESLPEALIRHILAKLHSEEPTLALFFWDSMGGY